MKIYLVGGAIRDKLLNIPFKDKDWVVVGATPKDMINAGYQQISCSFPVFLHPNSKEEYSLARTESNIGFRHTDFKIYYNINTTLEQDLQRRDLTINAMAQDINGIIIDPYNGQIDLKNRVLRHVSPKFSEDPLRVLRVARFAARYAHLNFHIAEETMIMMKQIVNSGSLQYLSPERIWKETENALSTYNPQIYFEVLHKCGALKILFPEVESLFGIPAPKKWHPEIDTGIHTLMSVKMAAILSDSIDIRFSMLCHDIGKSLTPKKFWPQHHNHGIAGVKLIEKLCYRLRVPNSIRDLAKIVAKYHDTIHVFQFLKSSSIVKLFDSIDAWRKPKRIEQIALASEADLRGRIGFECNNYPQGTLLREAWKVSFYISVKDIVQDGFKGKEIRDELIKRRIRAIDNWKKNNHSFNI